jgi:N-acetylglutamate synthase-like GNAT family acetyltransferase
MEIKEVEYNSDEWATARRIRYLLFYEHLGLPESLLDGAIEQIAFRLVLIARSTVFGCARLLIDDGCGVITQMAVLPQYQGLGAGRALMLALLNKARFLGISVLHLNARSIAKGFYENFGFVAVGNAFPSKTTGVEHIKMILKNSCSSRLLNRP